MRHGGILKPAKLAGALASTILLLGVSAATLSASDEKGQDRKPAPARAHEAPAKVNESAPARSRPEAAPARAAQAPAARPERQTPAYTPSQRPSQEPNRVTPAQQTPSPSYTPSNRQGRTPERETPSYTPSTRQGQTSQTPQYNAPARQQTQTPSYNPPSNRSQSGFNPSGSRSSEVQPGYTAPANSGGGFRRVDGGTPSNGNSHNPPSTSVYRLPPGQTTHNNDGSAIHVTSDGRTMHMDQRGRLTSVDVKGGGQIHYAPSGRPDRVVTRSGAVVVNRPGGSRQIIVERPNHVTIVTNPHGQGYIQRPFVAGGHEFYQRTYYYRGRPYVNVYRPYVVRGVYYPVYMPVHYYRPAFYGWVYAPWGRPVVYTWGWGHAPWYGYYGPYFAPYPVYRSPVFWLTDFFFSVTLEAAYEQQMADAAAAANYQAQQAMNAQVKQMVADEVQRQLAQERADSQNPNAMQGPPPDTLPGIFNDGASHALVVNNPLQANDGGMGCALTAGDVIGFEGNMTPGVDYASVRVLASKGQDCATNSVVGVSLQDILEMQNHLRETIDRGLGQLQSNAGRNGIPVMPSQAMGSPVATSIASSMPQPDPNAAAELSQQAQQATQDEQAVLNEAPPLDTTSAAEPTPTVTLGMTPSQVQSVLGPPRRVVDLGQKRMYIYDDMKVIFMDGRVSDVQ